jgi:hypothetical protein
MPRPTKYFFEHLTDLHISNCRLHQAKFAAARIAPRYLSPAGLLTGAQTNCRSGSSIPYCCGT